MPKIRYLIVAVSGYVIDLGIASIGVTYFKLPLTAAAALGFFTALTLNYMLHEYWTFSREESKVSLTRAGKTVASSVVTLGFRVLILMLAAPLATTNVAQIALLGFAAGITFVLNYAILRSLVFKST